MDHSTARDIRYQFISDKRRGFTLLEVLIVLAIICVLVALITPAVIDARKRAIETQQQQQTTSNEPTSDGKLKQYPSARCIKTYVLDGRRYVDLMVDNKAVPVVCEDPYIFAVFQPDKVFAVVVRGQGPHILSRVVNVVAVDGVTPEKVPK